MSICHKSKRDPQVGARWVNYSQPTKVKIQASNENDKEFVQTFLPKTEKICNLK